MEVIDRSWWKVLVKVFLEGWKVLVEVFLEGTGRKH